MVNTSTTRPSRWAPREEMIEALHNGKAKYANVFNYPTPSWADVGMIGWLVDLAAILNQSMLAKCSYGPYARAMLRICSEETFHKKQGQEIVITLARGTPEQREMTQDALNRWWWPTLMQFGYPDSESPHTATLKRWGIKTKTNDELREMFIREIVPELRLLGLNPPDPELRFDEQTGAWRHGPIDFDELKRVVNGNGPCNKERLAARIEGARRRSLGPGRSARLQGQTRPDGSGPMNRGQWPVYQVFERLAPDKPMRPAARCMRSTPRRPWRTRGPCTAGGPMGSLSASSPAPRS